MANRMPREIAPGVFWIGDCLAQLHKGRIYHGYNAAFLVAGESASVLVETGHPKDFPVIERHLAELFARVGLRKAQMSSYPHQFSGGQRQRIGIARALALSPQLIVADEPVSSLDVSIQAQVINLMLDLQRELGLAYLFISHNLAVIEHISHRIAVMYLGRIVEYTNKKALFSAPVHPYTELLLSAVPVPDPSVKRKRHLLRGDVPSPIAPPTGCHFHTRCPYAVDHCRVQTPILREIRPGHWAACHLR